nr:PREDICTED: uncharacterized protein LOC108205646 isoform X2 [Daucus carota subsp. sativus]
MSLPIEDRIWPNCLGRPVRNSSPVNIAEYISKGKYKEECDVSEVMPLKPVVNKTRSKVNVTTSRASSTPQTLSSDSDESPKSEKGLEMSSSRKFAKVAEYKTPALKPLGVSTKDMFTKRTRDEKSVGSGSSKAPVLLSPSLSPEAKKIKTASSATTAKSSPSVPLVFYGYNAHAKPTEFAHYLNDLLLPQYIESSNGKSPAVVSSEATGYAFHALQASLMNHEILVHEAKRMQKLEGKYSKCLIKLRVAQDQAAQHLKTAQEMQQDLDDFTAKVMVMEKETQEEAQRLISRHATKAKVEAVMEYFKGEHFS